MRASAIIFTGSYTIENGELSKNRTLASIPFAGRFRTIDFILSSLVAAGIRDVGVITKENYGSLEDHLGGGRYWDLDHKNTGLKILSPYSTNVVGNGEHFRGKLDALRSVQPYLERTEGEFVVLANGNTIANIDINAAIDDHIRTNADVTAVYTEMDDIFYANMYVLTDMNRRIFQAAYCSDKEDRNFKKMVLLNVYIVRRDFLLKFLKRANIYDYYGLERELLINRTDEFIIRAHRHKGWARIIYTNRQYYEASMELLKPEVRAQLFLKERPVMTKTKDTCPTLYERGARIENSLIADGCRIDGTVRNSIIFRDVVIQKGAVVEDCVIMQSSNIGAYAKLSAVIADKNTSVSNGVQLMGSPDYPYLLQKWTVV